MRWSQLVIGWLLGLAVLALVAVVAYNEVIPEHVQGMDIRAVPPPQNETVYTLDVERTRMEIPELAEALDEANATGEGDIPGNAGHEAYEYLVQVQREDPRTTSTGGIIFVEWKGLTYKCGFYVA